MKPAAAHFFIATSRVQMVEGGEAEAQAEQPGNRS